MPLQATDFNVGVIGANQGEKLSEKLFLALRSIRDHENPNVREWAIVRTIQKLHEDGMYLSEEAITHLRGVYCQGGMFVHEKVDA